MLDGYLYAIGGEDGPWVHRSVERFDPATNTWSPVADMVICRKYAGICLFCSINTYFYIKWLIYFEHSSEMIEAVVHSLRNLSQQTLTKTYLKTMEYIELLKHSMSK